MTRTQIAQRIEQEVTGWEGVSSAAHRFGGVEFRVGRREIGHLHGGHLADIPFPVTTASPRKIRGLRL